MPPKIRWGQVLELAIIVTASLLAVWIYFFAQPLAGMSIEAKRTLGVTVLALGQWAVFLSRAF